MTPSVTVGGRPATPEELAVLEAIERTGNPDTAGLPSLATSTAMIWLAATHDTAGNTVTAAIAAEPLPVAWAGRGPWLDYTRRLGIEIPPRGDGQPATVADIRRHIGTRRLWTTHVPAAAAA